MENQSIHNKVEKERQLWKEKRAQAISLAMEITDPVARNREIKKLSKLAFQYYQPKKNLRSFGKIDENA